MMSFNPFNFCSWYWILTLVIAIIILLTLFTISDIIIGRKWIPNLDKRYVLITGCDTGFGEQACRRLNDLGCHVIAGCYTEAGRKNIESFGSSRIKAILLDVTDDKSVYNAVSEVDAFLSEGTGLWGIVNNAGEPGNLGPLEWSSTADFLTLLNTNFIGQFRMIKALLPLMRRGRCGGRIVNTSSILGLITVPYAGPYCISKHAVEAMSDCLRMELFPYNISVSLVEPGTHKTQFLTKVTGYITSSWDNLNPELKEEYGAAYMKQVMFLGTRLIPMLGRSNLDGVIDSYCHALFSQRPHRRYLIGLDAIVLRVLALFPSFVLDFVFSLPGIRAVPQSCYMRR